MGVEFFLKKLNFFVSVGFSSSEFGSMSNCLIAVVVLKMEASSRKLLFCKTFHLQSDSLPVVLCSLHSYIE
jgi:hypothetical protein